MSDDPKAETIRFKLSPNLAVIQSTGNRLIQDHDRPGHHSQTYDAHPDGTVFIYPGGNICWITPTELRSVAAYLTEQADRVGEPPHPGVATDMTSYYEIQVLRTPGDSMWRTLHKGTWEEINEFWDINEQLLGIPGVYKRIVHVIKATTVTPIGEPS